jgi:glutathione S-transferase
MSNPTLHGPGFSTYVRSVRITLAEKGVVYDLNEFNFLEGWPDGYENLHPFKKVPVLEHDGLTLYETTAIMTYINAAFDGPALLSEKPAECAKSLQTIGIVDSYAYNALITRTFIQRAVVPMLGGTPDESMIEGAQGDSERAISVLNGRVTGQDYFGGDSVSLADCHVLPVIHYIGQIPEGQTLLGKAPALSAWMARMSSRDSVSSTVPSMG